MNNVLFTAKTDSAEMIFVDVDVTLLLVNLMVVIVYKGTHIML